jgi:outer membrane biosynthesis protein TonB
MKSPRLVLLCCMILTSFSFVFAQNEDATPHRKAVSIVQPDYPSILKDGHFDGQIRMAATVAPNGTVTKVEVKGGNPMLAQYASQAVMKWKYAPAPAQTVEEVLLNFKSSSR